MRIWKGIEREHNINYGKMTLFVESIAPDMNIVKTILSDNSDVECIYFGAGEVDILDWSFINELPKNIDYVIECSYANIVPSEYLSVFKFIIIRHFYKCVTPNMYIKLRTADDVYMAHESQFATNSITTVVDGQYDTDIELYDGRD